MAVGSKEDVMTKTGSQPLQSWNDTATKQAIIEFVETAVHEVPPGERVVVFDNDGTLWCEKPMQVELGFILERLAAMAEEEAPLRQQQPWKAAYERDYAWLGDAVTRHYAGDESRVKVLLGAIFRAFADMTVEEYEAAASNYLRTARHPTLGRAFPECRYVPMVELLQYLEANGFTNFIASGGDRDFMRTIAQEIYYVPPERVVGSSSALQYREDGQSGSVVYRAEPDVFDDGPAKPVRIWSRTGRRPIGAAGNSNGDIPMLQYSGEPSRRALRMLVLHDDAEREFDYTAGAEQALDRARDEAWTVVSIKDDWSRVFPDVQHNSSS